MGGVLAFSRSLGAVRGTLNFRGVLLASCGALTNAVHGERLTFLGLKSHQKSLPVIKVKLVLHSAGFGQVFLLTVYRPTEQAMKIVRTRQLYFGADWMP